MDLRIVLRSALAILALTGTPLVLAAQPDPVTGVKRTLESRFPDMKIVDVKPSPMPGLYEVFTGKEIIYASSTGDYVLEGTLLDTRSKTDLTEARVNERNAIRFDSLPLEKAIKVVKGDGSRKLAVFTDPDCPYCKRLEEEMKSVNNVTMYLFMFPLKIHPNAERHAKSIWCSNDRANAWTAWVLDMKEPEEKTCGNDPVQSTLELGEKLNISGTPTLYFENGSRFAGAMLAKDLETRLDRAKGGS